MNTFFNRFEDLWVAIAFAEAGAYEAFEEKIQARCTDPLRVYSI